MRTSSITLDTVEQKTVLIGSLKLGCCHRRPLADRRVLTEPVKILARPERAGKPPERERSWQQDLKRGKGALLTFDCSTSPFSLGRMAAPNRINFQKNSKWPSTPPLIFGKLCWIFFRMDNGYGRMRARKYREPPSFPKDNITVILSPNKVGWLPKLTSTDKKRLWRRAQADLLDV